ncbi:hypothetical protein RF11_00025 [Thelohanellus kitauei]|uniref:Uncharacterized protein n=1 Tax=Thelohanellus kitauei TaxID=669202 RepID=A0A0C2N312_THEKT|nr:hypothetical protein RF11_00025 [Thelohanellus kitauei]
MNSKSVRGEYLKYQYYTIRNDTLDKVQPSLNSSCLESPNESDRYSISSKEDSPISMFDGKHQTIEMVKKDSMANTQSLDQFYHLIFRIKKSLMNANIKLTGTHTDYKNKVKTLVNSIKEKITFIDRFLHSKPIDEMNLGPQSFIKS